MQQSILRKRPSSPDSLSYQARQNMYFRSLFFPEDFNRVSERDIPRKISRRGGPSTERVMNFLLEHQEEEVGTTQSSRVVFDKQHSRFFSDDGRIQSESTYIEPFENEEYFRLISTLLQQHMDSVPIVKKIMDDILEDGEIQERLEDPHTKEYYTEGSQIIYKEIFEKYMYKYIISTLHDCVLSSDNKKNELIDLIGSEMRLAQIIFDNNSERLLLEDGRGRIPKKTLLGLYKIGYHVDTSKVLYDIMICLGDILNDSQQIDQLLIWIDKWNPKQREYPLDFKAKIRKVIDQSTFEEMGLSDEMGENKILYKVPTPGRNLVSFP
jgi:hypothetical protein